MRYDRPCEPLGFLDGLFGGLRRVFRFVGLKENGGAILAAMVAELCVWCERIDVMPEGIQQLLVTYFGWIIDHFDRFRMPCSSSGHLFIARIGDPTPHISRGRRHHSLNLLEGFFHAPKT